MSRAPGAGPEFRADQPDTQGCWGQAAEHTETHSDLFSAACSRDALTRFDRAGSLGKGSERQRTDPGGAGRRSAGSCGGFSADRPVGGGAAGDRRQTEVMGCAGTGSALWASQVSPMSLLCSHLWLPGHSLTAGLWVKWIWGWGLRWDKLLAGITGSTAASPCLRPQSFDL